MTWNIKQNGVDSEIQLSSANVEGGQYELTADSAFVSDIGNVFDEWSIVTVKAPGVYSFEIKCLVSEFKNLVFYKAGTYEIDFIDRFHSSLVYESEHATAFKAPCSEKQGAFPFLIPIAIICVSTYS